MTWIQGDLDQEVTKICYHSKNVEPGAVFVCIEGTIHDGHDSVKEAVAQGATAVVCSKPLVCLENRKDIAVVHVNDSRKALAKMAATYYDYPATKLTTIGVTGTKGKTSTTYMMKSILDHGGLKCGLMGTVMTDTGSKQYPSMQTTPESLDVQRYLSEMVNEGCKAVVIEVSSQALKQHRVYGINFDIGIFTNIEEDHIGPLEHENFEEYLACKSSLFQQCKVGIVNGDDPNITKVIQGHGCNKILTYGLTSGCQLFGENPDYIRLSERFAVEIETKGLYNIKLGVGAVGDFSAYNGMAALLAAKELNITDFHIQKGLRDFVVPGRQEMFSLSDHRLIMVDYAHNGMSLMALLKELRKYNPSRLTCVFGCGGERDLRRRYNMGEAAAKYADFSVITSDNPRNESPTAIISDIINKMEYFHGDYLVLENRSDAIAYAVESSIPGEVVVIAGKGHETYQIIGNCKLHFDDREEVRKSIEKVNDEQNNRRRN